MAQETIPIAETHTVVTKEVVVDKDLPIMSGNPTEAEEKKVVEELEKEVAGSVSFKEESNVVGELPESEKKALDELKQLVQEALNKRELTAPVPKAVVVESEVPKAVEEVKVEEEKVEEVKKEEGEKVVEPKKVGLNWGLPKVGINWGNKKAPPVEEPKKEEEVEVPAGESEVPKAVEEVKGEEEKVVEEPKKEEGEKSAESKKGGLNWGLKKVGINWGHKKAPTVEEPKKEEAAVSAVEEPLVETPAEPKAEIEPTAETVVEAPLAEETKKEEEVAAPAAKDKKKVGIWGMPKVSIWGKSKASTDAVEEPKKDEETKEEVTAPVVEESKEEVTAPVVEESKEEVTTPVVEDSKEVIVPTVEEPKDEVTAPTVEEPKEEVTPLVVEELKEETAPAPEAKEVTLSDAETKDEVTVGPIEEPKAELVVPEAETPVVEEAPKEEKKTAPTTEEPKPVLEPESVSIWGIPLLADEKSDVVLLKFLRARDFKVKEAFTMLRNTVRWQQEFKIDSILEEDLGSELDKVVYISGVDKEGHPVCYNVYGEFQNKELYQSTFGDSEKLEKFIRWRVQFLEKTIRKELDFSPNGVSTFVQVNDLKASPGPFKRELKIATDQALQLLQDNYPEFVAKQVFINVPWLYLAFYKVISPFFTQRTKSKFVFAGPSRSAETLFKYIAPEQVPEQYGGLSKEGEQEFTTADPATEDFIKPATKSTIEFPASEASTLVWEARVIGWDVLYGAEFVPTTEGGYTVIIQKPSKISPVDETILSGSYTTSEAGKVVLTFDNSASSKKKKLLYRSKTKPSE